MRKAQIAIGIVAALAAFAAVDFYLNGLGRGLSLDLGGKEPENVKQEAQPAVIVSAFRVGDNVGGFKVMSQTMASQVFDKVDLAAVKNIRVAKTQMERPVAPAEAVLAETDPVNVEGAEAPAPVVAEPEPLTLYEIQGPKGQGALTYLAVKLQFVAQINAVTETINEDGKYGDNSFFYNDQNLKSTGFLLAQIGDNLYGFQYNKTKPATYEAVQGMIGQLTPKP